MELNETNVNEAYCKVIAATGFGAAEDDCDDLLPETVLVRVPQEMHEDYPARLLASAIRICTNEPYNWSVQNEEPTINSETTFQSLRDEWFISIVYE